MTFAELLASVYTELKEGSVSNPPENYPLSMVKDFINEGYSDVFNQPYNQPSVRNKTYTFKSSPDTVLSADVISGATTLQVSSTTSWPTSGTILLNGVDVVTYTGTTATTFTGCSGVSEDYDSGDSVRCLHAMPSDASEDRLIYLKDSARYTEASYIPYEDFWTKLGNVFTVYNGKLLLSENTTSSVFMLVYLQDIEDMTNDSDTPSLLPERFHKLLVFYAAGRALAQEQDDRFLIYYNPDARGAGGRNGAGLYFNLLHRFYAKYSRQTGRKKTKLNFIYNK